MRKKINSKKNSIKNKRGGVRAVPQCATEKYVETVGDALFEKFEHMEKHYEKNQAQINLIIKLLGDIDGPGTAYQDSIQAGVKRILTDLTEGDSNVTKKYLDHKFEIVSKKIEELLTGPSQGPSQGRAHGLSNLIKLRTQAQAQAAGSRTKRIKRKKSGSRSKKRRNY